jgi:phosphoglycerate dehydrogenase-like enzyme
VNPPYRVLVAELYGPERMAALRARFPGVEFIPVAPDGPHPQAADADALLFAGMNKAQLSALLRAAPRVDWIHTGSAGFDWVVVPEVASRGITLTRTAGAMNGPMAEFALGVMLRHAKRFPELEAAQARRAWAPVMADELDGATLGVVGAGAIGERLAALARPFGMRVLGIKRSPRPLPGFDAVWGPEALHELLEASDVVVLATPLTPETRGMIGAPELARLRPHAQLLNLARGALVDGTALADALRAGRLAAAWMDAFETEPLPADDPLWSVPNLFVTPHCSYRSQRVRDRVIGEFAANLERRLGGAPLAHTMREPALGY